MINDVIQIMNLEIPALHPYRTLKRPLEHRKQGIFIAEGEKVVRRLLQSPIVVLSILVTHEWFEILRPVLVSRECPIDVYVAEKQLLETIVGHQLHQGIMGLGKNPRAFTIDELRSLGKPFFFAAIDGLVNAENVGVVVRNCAASGVQAIIVGPTSADPYLRRAVRNSMGTIFKIPVVYSCDLVHDIELLRSGLSVSTYACHPREGSKSVYEVDFTGNTCIIVGNEGDGVSEEVVKACTDVVQIPMENNVDSFNVASASAVVLCEVLRQRTEIKKPKTR